MAPGSTLGLVQFVGIGLDNDKQRGQVAREMQGVSDRGINRIRDLLASRKESDGSFMSLGLSDLSRDERGVYGAVLGGLLGLGAGAKSAPRWGPSCSLRHSPYTTSGSPTRRCSRSRVTFPQVRL